ncbi:patatin-like phospholipase family protein [Novosphingobium profundi]|uniref:patatin-like phospholipase family protein n=1 Tax=Novosphingobium profundi TaxID=1774954 RepID=UPI001BD992A7|nr:patatin-like phospholipase family protein [Novosphingobium profundi]MBT0671355.1 patatin-like phospholipase family protein [Novosphingobium profundi]
MPSTRNIGLDLALQGGGAHGAFTWGVLERLLEEERIWISALSGASAGAINAAVFASGLVTGGREGARAALGAFWKAIHRSGRDAGPLLPMMEAFPATFEAISQMWSSMFANVTLPSSPELGARTQEMLREVLVEHIDFAALHSDEAPRLFLSATDVRTGSARIFANEELSPEVLLASACLPLLFPPVTIEGVDYWDGGYSANPPIFPLVQNSPNDDLMVVTINPMSRAETPRGAAGISNRLTELAFSQTLVKDMRGLVLIQNEVGPLTFGKGLLARLRRLRVHEIHDEATLAAMPAGSKMMPLKDMLLQLHEAGREAAANWVRDHGEDLGRRSSADLAARYAP